MARTSDARDKAIATAERLFRTHGYAATGLTQIISESGSPKGSFYHHFPGGKDELAEEALASFCARGLALIENLSGKAPDDPVVFTRLFCGSFAEEMRQSQYTLGCALQTLALERAPHDTVLTAQLHTAFSAWLDAISRHYAACGVDDPHTIATALLAGLEGARTIARVFQNSLSFDATAVAITTMLAGR